MSDTLDDDLLVEPLRLEGYEIPEGSDRVQVTDSTGKLRWRKIADFQHGSDVLFLNDGNPVFMRGGLGRPPGVAPARPGAPANLEDQLKIKASQLRSDPIVTVVSTTPDAPEVLSEVLNGLAEESASLRFERAMADQNGQDSTNISIRRVTSLKALADTWLKRKEQLTAGVFNIESPAFRAVLGLVTETFVRAMEDTGIRSEQIEITMSNFSRMFDEKWKDVARERIKSAQ